MNGTKPKKSAFYIIGKNKIPYNFHFKKKVLDQLMKGTGKFKSYSDLKVSCENDLLLFRSLERDLIKNNS